MAQSVDLFIKDGTALRREIERQNRTHEFDLEGYAFNAEMLDAQISGKINSWWIRWYATAFVLNKLTLWPHHVDDMQYRT